MNEELEFTKMRRSDLRAVMAIEEAVFDDPWNLTIFVSELALRTGRSYKVVRLGRKIVGYRGLMFLESIAHVSTIAVHPAHRRSGIGAALMIDAMHSALANRCDEMTLEVATTNEGAQALYRRFGFAPVGVRKNYYQRTGTDAIIMTAEDIDSPAYAARLQAIIDERVDQ